MQFFHTHTVYFAVFNYFILRHNIYEFQPGDIFFINQFESHYLSQIDQMNHERVVLSIYPDYLKQLSTTQTDLGYCFTYRSGAFSHRISLTEDEQKQFMYFIHKLSENRGFGQDVLDQAAFLEIMTFLNRVFNFHCTQESETNQSETKAIFETRHAQIDEILSYINQHLSETLSITMLAAHFYLSTSYLCRIFKNTTGTTINRYITAKRISWAKVLLLEGHSVAETSSLCGFGDYSNFLRSFSKIVGMSPRKYVELSRN